MPECPEPAPFTRPDRDARAAVVIEAARRFADNKKQLPYWRENCDVDTAVLVDAVQEMEDAE